MQYRHRWRLLLGILAQLAFSAYAQTPVTVLNYDEAVQMALTRQPGLAASHQEADAAKLLVDAAQAKLYPHLSLQASDLFSSTQNDTADFISANGPREIIGQIVLSQQFYSAPAFALKAAAQAAADFARYRTLQSRLEVADSVTSTFFILQAQQAAVRIWRESVSQAETSLQATEKGVQAGKRTQLDLLRAQSALRDAQAELGKTEAEQKNSVQLLSLMTGLPAPLALTPLAPLPDDLTLPSLDEIVATALTNQPALAMAKSDEQRQAALLAASKAQRQPHAWIEAAYGWDTLGLPWKRSPGWSAGVNLSMPLFNGESRAKEQAARLRFGASRERARQVELDLRQTLSSALGNAKVALTSYKAGKEDTRIKKHIWHISEEGYRAGKLSSIDLILAQQEWFNSQQAQLKQIANLRYAVARMHLLMGQLAKDDL